MTNNNTNRNWSMDRLSGDSDISDLLDSLVEESWESKDGETSTSLIDMAVCEDWETYADELLSQSNSNEEDDDSSQDGDSSDSEAKPLQAMASRTRVRPYQGYSWEDLIAIPAFKSLDKLAGRVERRYVARKLNPKQKRDMDDGLINRDALDGTVLNIKSSLGQIIRWLKGASRDSDDIEFNLRALCRPKVFEAWYNWALDYWDGSPQTPVNKCLAYKNLLEWLLTRDSFKDLNPKIQKTLNLVKDYISGLKRKVARWKYTYTRATKLLVQGEMLSSDDLLELNRKVWADLKSGIDKIENNLNKKDRSGNKKLAYKLQTNLQILLFCRLAGQRREVVVTLDDNQVQLLDNGRLVIQPLREKKVRETGHGIEQDDLMSKLLKWFLRNARPLLDPQRGVKAWWLNTKGKPQSGKDMSKKIKRQIAEYLPGTSITPASLRRQYATMFESSEWTADMDKDQFWKELAGVMNTGVATLEKHYKRMKSPKKQTDLLQKINFEWNQDEDVEDKMHATEELLENVERPQLPDSPMEDLAEFEVAEILDKQVSRKGGVQYLVRWEGYKAEDATWEKLTNLECALQAVEEYEINKVLGKKKKVKKQPEKKNKNKKKVIKKKKKQDKTEDKTKTKRRTGKSKAKNKNK